MKKPLTILTLTTAEASVMNKSPNFYKETNLPIKSKIFLIRLILMVTETSVENNLFLSF